MEKVRDPADCEHYPLCQHLHAGARDIPVVLLMIAMQIEAESVCRRCPYFEAKETKKNSIENSP